MVEDRSFNGKMFNIINYVLLTIIGLITVLPFVHVVAGSFTTSAEMAAKSFVLIPTDWSIEAYKFIFSTSTIFRAMAVSIGTTAAGTALSMLVTALMAYGLSRRDLDGRKFIMFLVAAA
jgi:putative aldouronate transport system permease protein